MVTIRVNGLKEAERAIGRMPRLLSARSSHALFEVGRVVQAEGRKNAPISPTKSQAEGDDGYKFKSGRSPGTLTNSIELIPGASSVTVGVVHGAALKYAEKIDKGGYRRGPGTVSKGPQAGPHYIDRAWDDRNGEMVAMYRRLGVDPVIKNVGRM